jgi:uncharacterized protein (TIGR02145 family)
MYPRIILFIFFPLFGFSQAPQKINFQSILRNTNGEVVANKNVKLKISIQSGSMMDTTVYSETHLKTTDVSGLMSLKIGTGTSLMGRFDSIKWGKASHFIKLEADFNGGNNFVLLGTQELMSVPYAFHSNTADSLVGGINLKDIKDELANLRRQMDTLLLAPVFDIDGNQYGVVKIGNVLWLNQNLKVSRYNNGDSIGYGTGWLWYNNDRSNDALYGKLYSYSTVVDNRKICPVGWKIPDDYSPSRTRNYWYLFDNLYGPNGGFTRDIAGLKLKLPQFGGTNDYGWNGVLGGRGFYNYPSAGLSFFDGIDLGGSWWFYPEPTATGACGVHCVFSLTLSSPSWGGTTSGGTGHLSVRCVKDY